jgi:hypothetical protein
LSVELLLKVLNFSLLNEIVSTVAVKEALVALNDSLPKVLEL